MPKGTNRVATNGDKADLARRTRLIQDAIARGQAALADGDQADALRWLDRAHRLAPLDGTISVLLASTLLGRDHAAAAALFAEVLEAADARDAWLGLATARFLSRDLAGARHALTELLSRHAWGADVDAIADHVARAAGEPGWCALTGGGELIVRAAGPAGIKAGARPGIEAGIGGRIEARIDGRLIEGTVLPPDWPCRGTLAWRIGDIP